MIGKAKNARKFWRAPHHAFAEPSHSDCDSTCSVINGTHEDEEPLPPPLVVEPFWLSHLNQEQLCDRRTYNEFTLPFGFKHAPDKCWPRKMAATAARTISARFSTPPLQPHLLDLPPEIRLQIFSYFLIGEGDDDTIVVERDGLCTFPMGGIIAIMLYHWELTRPLIVCRQLYEELMPLFYGSNKFYFPGVPELKMFLKGIGGRRRQLIRHVILGDLDGRSKQADYTFRLLGQSCDLKYLEINLDTAQDAAESEGNSLDLSQRLDISKIKGTRVLQRLRGLETFILKDEDLTVENARKLEVVQNALSDVTKLPKQGAREGSSIPAMLPTTRESDKLALHEIWQLFENLETQRSTLSREEQRQQFEELAGEILRRRYLQGTDDYLGIEDDPDAGESTAKPWEDANNHDDDDGNWPSHQSDSSDHETWEDPNNGDDDSGDELTHRSDPSDHETWEDSNGNYHDDGDQSIHQSDPSDHGIRENSNDDDDDNDGGDVQDQSLGSGPGPIAPKEQEKSAHATAIREYVQKDDDGGDSLYPKPFNAREGGRD